MKNKYNSIISAFDSESSSELPPEYSAALLSFSKEMNSFSKDYETNNSSGPSSPTHQSPADKLSEKLSQQLSLLQQSQINDMQDDENENSESASFQSPEKSSQPEIVTVFSPNSSEINTNKDTKDDQAETIENPIDQKENESINNSSSVSFGSENDSSPDRRSQVRDKLKAIREMNKKKKQENEKKNSRKE